MTKIVIDESKAHRAPGVSVTVKADPLEIDLDPAELGKLPAEAIAQSISAGIRNCAVPASAATLRQRRAKGITNTNKWHATGRLAASIKSQRSGNEYTILATASDRLEDPMMLEKLALDVPEIANPVTPDVERAIERTAETMVRVRRR